MNDYKFSSHILARIPLLEIETGKHQYETILARKDFRAALFFASRSFYNELSKKEFDYAQLSEKQKLTVKKYINRAMFRSTPFGMFAAVSLLPWGPRNECSVLSEPHPRIKTDFATLHELWERQSGRMEFANQYFQTNSSLYFNEIDFRYIKKLVEGNKAKFSVVSIEKDPLLQSLLSFCKKPRTLNDISHFLMAGNVSEAEARSFVRELTGEQVLISCFSPNITGRDYASILASNIQNEVIKFIGINNEVFKSADLDRAITSASRMDVVLGRPNDTNYFYCISERKMEGSLGAHYQKSLEDGLNCLLHLSSSYVSADLTSFVKAFEKKYESAELPLLEVLDAQFGIGYGGLDQITVNYGFASTGYSSNGYAKKNAVPDQSNLAAVLIKDWQLSTVHNQVVEITDAQLLQLGVEDVRQKPAMSLSLLFRMVGDSVYIESAGGPSSLSLIGRFAFADDVYEHAKVIAAEEQRQNKNVVLAEIAHLCDLHSANINRRPHFYDYEIPVLTNSVLPEEKQIHLDDLFVSVRNDKVVLRSKRLNKVIIPRLSSAFNYTRNDLPVFRFLCDVQGQDTRVSLGFSLSSLVPGLPFYPRVCYKSCILQLAEWHIDAAEIKPLIKGENIFAAFRQFAERVSLPKYFSYSVGDNFLVFNRDCMEDIDLFLKEVENKKEITLKEFPFLDGGTMQTGNGKTFLPQFVASLILQKDVFPDLNFQWPQDNSMQATDDWVYCKLYCHPLSSDIIMLNQVLPFIEKLKEGELLESWFWVRYNDPDYHLRIRVRARPGSKQKVFRQMTACMDRVCAKKLGSHFQTDIYKRELERYSTGLIGEIEGFFHQSSELVASWLSQQRELSYEDQNVILNGVLSSVAILNTMKIADKAGFCKNAFEAFFKEFNAPKELKTEMEKLYKDLDAKINWICSCGELPGYEAFIESIQLVHTMHLKKEIKEVSLEKLALDMIHMHLNRLFIYNQRYFEMVHYYLLYRALYKQKFKGVH